MTEFVEVPAGKGSLGRRKPVYGVGINDAQYETQQFVDGKQVSCPYYSTWRGILQRCYSASYQERQPTYLGCTVCDEWLIFSNFKSWMKSEDWKGKALDKDILEPGNKIYSSVTCLFVTGAVNGLLNNSRSARGEWPQGVCWHKQAGSFQAQCWVNNVYKFLGCFSNPDEAANAYNSTKAKEITRIAYLQTDVRIRDGLLRHAELRCAA